MLKSRAWKRQASRQRKHMMHSGLLGSWYGTTPVGQYRFQKLATEFDEPLDIDPESTAAISRFDYVQPPSRGTLIAALTAERDRLRETLNEIASGNRTAHESMLWARQTLKEGL